ncbi:MAG: ABC transporter substrate-binding protein [SAR324 cluster bacterium]|nr:ABC transporter substrate-binding protein [SAR324 cluster bacterium]
MKLRSIFSASVIAVTAIALALALAPSAWGQKRGGTLVMVVAGQPPGFDGHQEATFAMVHPTAPHYSLLIKADPTDPTAVKVVPDLATSWKITEGGKVYTFKLRRGVKFHDGKPLTARDVVASFRKLHKPPKGTRSLRKAFFEMIDTISNPDDYTVVFRLKDSFAAFLNVVSIPFNYVYSADQLAQNMNWYQKNVLGSGPFKFVSYSAGSNWVGTRNENYFRKGRPYLDGFEAIFAPKMNLRVQAIRGRRAMIEFRGFPPAARDDLKRALGKDIRVQQSTWNCSLLITPNPHKKPFDDERVRRALSLALDRYLASRTLSRIAIMKTMGQAVFPGHALSLNAEEIQQLPGFGKDIKANRAEARRLLKEAGVPEGFEFELHNRAVDQPYKILGTWAVDQWRQIGLKVEQKAVPTGPWRAGLRKNPPEYEVAIDANCQTVVNPTLDISKFISTDRSGNNYARYTDRVLDRLYDENFRETDPVKQKEILRKFQMRLATKAWIIHTLWWERIIPHNAAVMGWNISPSHYLNQDLTDVWLNE